VCGCVFAALFAPQKHNHTPQSPRSLRSYELFLEDSMKAKLFSMLLIVALIYGCGGRGLDINFDSAQPEPRSDAFETMDCPFHTPDIGPDEPTLECGMLTVPENHAEPNGPTIKIAVAINKTSAEKPKGDPVLFLMINPSPELRFAAFMGFFFSGINQERDLIAVDVRGVGYSEPAFECPAVTDAYYKTLDASPVDPASVEMSALAYANCYQDWLKNGVDLANFNSQEIAADLIDLREALGYKQWNIISVGYGARVAQMLMRDDAQGTRSVVMDSLEPVGVDVYSDSALNAQRALDLAFQRCLEDTKCAAAYPDARGDFYRLVDQLNAAPLTVEVAEPNSGTRYQMTVDGYRLIDLAIISVGAASPNFLGQLPRTVEQVRNGNTAQLKATLSQLIDVFAPESPGLRGRINCLETLRKTSLENVNKANQRVEPQLADYYNRQAEIGFEGCQVWEGMNAKVDAEKPVSSNVPALILNGEYDPWTSPEWSKNMAGKLGRAYLVTMTGAGSSGFFGDTDRTCISTLVGTFLAEPNKKPDTTCAQKDRPMLWVTIE
jgi:pimeloyl-ACP methyl ester carboxylesterase